jgi:hypothetical protein
MRRQTAFAAAALVTCTLGCGTTFIRFQELDPKAEPIHQTPTQVYTIDCQDYESGTRHSVSCTKDGGGIPWKVLGVYHAGVVAFDKWDKYNRQVVAKAQSRGCPAVLIRRAAPSTSSQSEAVGALCVDTTVPSGVNGPLRLSSVGTTPLRVLSDGEP